MQQTPSFILVTDRNPHIRALICRQLARHGFVTRTVGDGRALCGLLASSPPPALLILDPELPSMDLPSVWRELESWAQRIPVVVHAFGPDEEAAWPSRAATTVEKDVDLDKLVRCVAGLLSDAAQNAAQNAAPDTDPDTSQDTAPDTDPDTPKADEPGDAS